MYDENEFIGTRLLYSGEKNPGRTISIQPTKFHQSLSCIKCFNYIIMFFIVCADEPPLASVISWLHWRFDCDISSHIPYSKVSFIWYIVIYRNFKQYNYLWINQIFLKLIGQEINSQNTFLICMWQYLFIYN